LRHAESSSHRPDRNEHSLPDHESGIVHQTSSAI
jgi:hypothetical protein